jgi:hypothetical protein
MRIFAVALLALHACACTARLAPAGSPERCAKLDDRYQWSGAVWKGGAVVSAGLGAAAVPDSDDPELRRALAWGALGAAAVTAGAAFVQETAAESHSRDCVREWHK